MSSTLDRLRRLQSLRTKRSSGQSPEPTLHSKLENVDAAGLQDEHAPLEALVPGTEVETACGMCYVSERRFPLDEVRGSRPLDAVLAQRPTGFAHLYPAARLDEDFDFARAAFLDTETTGLGGGAGVFAFMVGVGVFETGPDEQSAFVVRQYFTRHPGEEPALLEAVSDLLQRRESMVTFNGRTFDVPLLRGRYRLNRHLLPGGKERPHLLFNDAPHLDLLHPARRLWQKRLQSCALANLEREILNHQRTVADVPGSEIPMLYQQFLLTGRAGPIQRIFYHNLEDIVSMVALAEQVCRHYSDPGASVDSGELTALELASLGRTYEQAERLADAERAYRRALELSTDRGAQADVFFRLGRLLKRQERWTEAAEVWQQWLSTVPGPDPQPYVELAKFCEWQTKDLEQAEMWTSWALHNLSNTPGRHAFSHEVPELEHRLRRIQKKRQGDHRDAAS